MAAVPADVTSLFTRGRNHFLFVAFVAWLPPSYQHLVACRRVGHRLDLARDLRTCANMRRLVRSLGPDPHVPADLRAVIESAVVPRVRRIVRLPLDTVDDDAMLTSVVRLAEPVPAVPAPAVSQHGDGPWRKRPTGRYTICCSATGLSGLRLTRVRARGAITSTLL